jgi:arginine kinase
MDVKPLKALQQLMKKDAKNNSITKKHLTDAIVAKYENKKTSLGGTLALCVNTNAYNPGALLCRSADSEAYETFRDFFDAVIKDYHKVSGNNISHPKQNFGDPKNLPFGAVDPTGKYVVSTRVRCGRTVKGYPFAPVITKNDRIALESKIADALRSLDGELKGKYHGLDGMDKNLQKQLIADHFLFRDDDNVLRDAGGYRDWPTGRGIFFNNAKTFLVWINEEDHLRIISMQQGGNLAAVYKRLTLAVQTLEKKLDFVTHDRFGFLTFCPSNLGTTMRASVHVRIPHLARMPNFKEMVEGYNLQARGTGGEHTASVGGVYDISNMRRLGLTEIQAAQEMAKGVAQIIELEQSLERNNAGVNPSIMPVEPLRVLAQLLWNDKSCDTIVKRHLTEAIVKKYERIRTRNGVSLAHLIRNCAYNRKAICPRMGDADCLTVFAEYTDAVIREYHKVAPGRISHPKPTFGNLNNLPFDDLDPSGKFIVSTRVRVGRSVEGYNFPTAITKEQRGELEKRIAKSLQALTGEHAGKYYPLQGMDPKVQKSLIDDHFLFLREAQ